jgi:hypothetical protein
MMTEEIGFEAQMSQPYPKDFKLMSDDSTISRSANPKVILGVESSRESEELQAVSLEAQEK